jgi:hypothetical protein
MVFRVALSLIADHKDMLLQCRNFEQVTIFFFFFQTFNLKFYFDSALNLLCAPQKNLVPSNSVAFM